jgi:hypothetical protein
MPTTAAVLTRLLEVVAAVICSSEPAARAARSPRILLVVLVLSAELRALAMSLLAVAVARLRLSETTQSSPFSGIWRWSTVNGASLCLDSHEH